MTKLNAWKKAAAVFVFCSAATAVAAPAQNFTSLFSFDGADGSVPSGGALVQGVDGTFYGTTVWGGSNVSCHGSAGCGTVFEITRDGVLTTLHRFCLSQATCPDGFNPSALILARDGNFYGTTAGGGAYGAGTFFRITPRGSLTTLYSFCAQPNCSDGYIPDGGVIEGIDGNFYGTTAYDGACGNYGTVYKLTSEGKLTTLHSFCGGTDGASPGGLVQATDGSLYGITTLGGDFGCEPADGGCGTVFRVTTKGKLTTLHAFDGNDGEFPVGGLIQATDGNLYGDTLSTLTCRYRVCGTVFKISLRGTLTTLYQFCQRNGCGEGSNLESTLVQGTYGNLYGSTFGGGSIVVGECLGGCGTAFKMTLNGSLTNLHDFGSADGSYPLTMLQGTDGKFYGATDEGGIACPPHGCGTIFSLDTGLGPFVAFVQAAGRVGQTGGILGQGFTGTTNVSLNGTPASYTVVSDTFIRATVPPGATTGYVTVTTPSGTLTSNVPFRVIP